MKWWYVIGVAALLLPATVPGADNRVQAEVLRNSSGQPVRYAGQLSGANVLVPTAYEPKPAEVRGVWLATIDNIDFPVSNNVEAFKRNYLEVINNLQRIHVNTLFFQVRPMNDAFYRSALNPWSRFLTGSEGRGLPNFDPLKFMIDEAHRRGIQFHAWFNPYRVTKHAEGGKLAYLRTLAANNFARLNPGSLLEVVKNGKRQLILDPGDPKVIQFLINTVRELIRDYDVDGIHFDDYFYPYGGCGNVDARTYARYNPRRLPLETWRLENVNTLVYGVSKAIEAHNRTERRRVQFGISPFGIWRNVKSDPNGSLTCGSESYSGQYADTRRWIRSGWIDYVTPQVYWTFDHDLAAYAAVTDWWVKTVRGTKVNLYIGHIPSFYGTGRWRNPREIPAQLRYNSTYPEVKGDVMFSYKSLFRPENYIMKKGAELLVKDYWTKYVPPPSCGPYQATAPAVRKTVPATPTVIRTSPSRPVATSSTPVVPARKAEPYSASPPATRVQPFRSAATPNASAVSSSSRKAESYSAQPPLLLQEPN